MSFTNLLLGLVTKAVKEAADRLDVNPKVDEFEAFLKKYSAVLHQNHVILIDKKYTLAKMYGRMEGKFLFTFLNMYNINLIFVNHQIKDGFYFLFVRKSFR